MTDSISKADEAKRLTEDILEAILALSALDFSKTLEVGFEDSGFNAVAAGLNMLGEELRRSVVSIDYVNNIIESMDDSLLVINSAGNIGTINNFCATILGYKKENLLDKPAELIFCKYSYEKIVNLLSVEHSESLRAQDIDFITKDAIKIPMQINASVIMDKYGASTGLLLVGRDMRKTLALIASAEQAARDLKEARDILEQQVLKRTKELRKANTDLNNEIEVRKQAEAEVSAREQKFRNIFETATVAIVEADFTEFLQIYSTLENKNSKDLIKNLGQNHELVYKLLNSVKILDTNQATLEMFEADDKYEFAKSFKNIFTDKSSPWLEAGIEALNAKQNYFETACGLNTFSNINLEVLAQVRLYESQMGSIGGLITIVDLSEIRSLKEQLRQSQKMEAVGQVAGGIAHDFNNLLTVILSYGQMVLDDLPPGHDLRSKISPMVECSEKAAGLTKQLLAFSRRQVIEPKIIDLNELISAMEKLLKRVLGEQIELNGSKATDLGRVKCDPGQIEQIVMNLAVNARDAMPHGGKLIIETKNIILNKEYVKNRADLAPGAYALIAFSDTGTGMTAEVKARIFEPFYTTKEVGKGTGLGLSTVYGIVKQNSGHVEVYSELGHGTVFKIYLPLVDKAVIEEQKTKKIDKKDLAGNDTIFVVEDEDSVRMVACQILKKSGYQVLEASDPLKAIEFIDSHHGKIDLLLSDVIMPNMKGPTMAEKICAKRPDLKVLFMSGYTDNAINQNGILDEGKEFLQKPFTPTSLLKRVKEILSDKSA